MASSSTACSTASEEVTAAQTGKVDVALHQIDEPEDYRRAEVDHVQHDRHCLRQFRVEHREKLSPAAVAAWKAPAAPPGVGTSDPTIAQPSTKIVSLIPNGNPKARNTSMLATPMLTQTTAVQPTVIANSRTSTKTRNARASCSRMLITAARDASGQTAVPRFWA